MVFGGKQKIESAAVEVGARAEIRRDKEKYGNGRGAARGLLASADLFANQVEQLRDEQPRNQEQQNPGIEVFGKIPTEPLHTEGPEQLKALAGSKIEQVMGEERYCTKREGRGELQWRRTFASPFGRRPFLVEKAKKPGQRASQHCSAGNGVQGGAMEREESSRPGEIAGVVEIRGKAGGDEQRRSEPREAGLKRAREREGSERLCDGFQWAAPGREDYDAVSTGVTRERASGTMRNEMGAGPMGSPSTWA